ncbi:hypothetical protein K505DRAFT_416434 [Melanomma pulvis-pyrius CBS 109.77]|uniref:Uncharacterized protein n=1 Tax=Melanomma pulvis-pyrius CBS 109.77 TaxID=1314802 RepID=A0A6A6XG58_9PLEO|nr:hypothetical protein K505DRAFT_416434 [Melanomma pulvis-pyrius CBS 109.77]
MSCQSSSCSGGDQCQWGRRDDGYDAEDSTSRLRSVLRRNSTEETEAKEYNQGTSRDMAVYDDEKSTSYHPDDLLGHYGEETDEQSMQSSEEHPRDGVDRTEPVQEETRQFSKRSVGFRRRPKTSPASLSTNDTADELHRRAEFEKVIKKMDDADKELAWAFERERREAWKSNRRNLTYP